MLFNSYIFIFCLLPIALLGYFFFNSKNRYKLAQGFLLIMSLIFYGYFNISYLPIIIFSILFNFLINKLLQKDFRKNIRMTILVISILVNIGILFYFKYFDFFIYNINKVFNTGFFMRNILLPLGISFFTFQQVSYTVDCYKKQVPDYQFLNYATFVAFFPQLIAGPIVLHNETIPQFEDVKKRKFNYDNFSKGLLAFALGLGKKVLIADIFAKIVSIGYGDIAGLNTTTALLLVFSYTMQIYFDFSGYCDMATGLGLMFNIKIAQNFNSPYKAKNIMDFWARWHMTLTRFFKKYVYIPLGGSRKGNFRTYINIAIIFLVSGLWHGANWTFIIWGALHGLFFIITKMLYKYIKKIPEFINWAITFMFVSFTWIFFSAPSVTDAKRVILKIIDFDFGRISNLMLDAFKPQFLVKTMEQLSSNVLNIIPLMVYSLFAISAVLFMKNTNERIDDFKLKPISSIITIIIMVISIISLSEVSTFLYFNF